MTATIHNIRPLPRGVAPVNATQLRMQVAVQRVESRRRREVMEIECCAACKQPMPLRTPTNRPMVAISADRARVFCMGDGCPSSQRGGTR